MIRLKCKIKYGVWFYEKIFPNDSNDLDAPIYELYDRDQQFVDRFGCYGDMKYYVETGVYL